MLNLITFVVTKFWQKRKGTQGIIEIENPNITKTKNVKAKNADVSIYKFFFTMSVTQ